MTLMYYVQLILTLGGISGLLWLALRFSKSAYQKKYSGEIKILDRVSLDTNVAFMIVQVRHKELLVSISNKSVTVHEHLN